MQLFNTETPHRPVSFWVYVPPPPLFVVAFLVGLGLDHIAPLLSYPPAVVPIARAIGIVALAAAGGLLLPAPLLFLLRRTTIIPHGSARTLVTAGPYRLTRNPMYLALTIAYLGGTLVAAAMWPLALLALPLWVLSTRVIPFEEAKLTQIFGDEYRRYQQRVRRWI